LGKIPGLCLVLSSQRTRKRKAPFERLSSAGPGSRPLPIRTRPLPIRIEARRAVSKASRAIACTPRKRSALGIDPNAVPRAKASRFAFTGLIRKWRVWWWRGFCIENPLTPTGSSRRKADIADRVAYVATARIAVAERTGYLAGSLRVDLSGRSAEPRERDGRPRLKKLGALLTSPTNQPTPSGGEFRRLAAIDLRLPIAGLRRAKESFEIFELF
jgi:hypothetical protein